MVLYLKRKVSLVPVAKVKGDSHKLFKAHAHMNKMKCFLNTRFPTEFDFDELVVGRRKE